jgi:polyisoprenoid-binding protein YceI
VSPRAAVPTVFDVLPRRSAVLVKARSNVGPIAFATSEVRGTISAELDGKVIDLDTPITAELTVSLSELTSGNTLYDTELKRRIDVRRYPDATLHLDQVTRVGASNQFDLTGRIELHAVARALHGVVEVERLERDVMIVRGQQTLDIRDFDLDVPPLLALKIYPEVSVEMHLEARTP